MAKPFWYEYALGKVLPMLTIISRYYEIPQLAITTLSAEKK
jgi:hypothetical protein